MKVPLKLKNFYIERFVAFQTAICSALILVSLFLEIWRFKWDSPGLVYEMFLFLSSKNWFTFIDTLVKAGAVIGGISIVTGVIGKVDNQYYFGLFSIAFSYIACFITEKLKWAVSNIVFGIGTMFLLLTYLLLTFSYVLSSSIYYQKYRNHTGIFAMFKFRRIWRFQKYKNFYLKRLNKKINIKNANFSTPDFSELISNKYIGAFVNGKKKKVLDGFNDEDGFGNYFNATYADISAFMKKLSKEEDRVQFSLLLINQVNNKIGTAIEQEITGRHCTMIGFYSALLYATTEILSADSRKNLVNELRTMTDPFWDIRRWCIITLIEMWNFLYAQEYEEWTNISFDPDCYFVNNNIAGADSWLITVWNTCVQKLKTNAPAVDISKSSERFKKLISNDPGSYYWSTH